MTNIIILDDHFVVLKGLANLLESMDYNIVGKALNETEFWLVVASVQEKIDIVFIDIMLDKDYNTAAKITKEIVAKYPTIKVIAISSDSHFYKIKQMVLNGISGFISKTADSKNYQDIIAKILKGENVFLLERVEKGSNVLKYFTAKQILAHAIELTLKEIDFLKLCSTDKCYDTMAIKMEMTKFQIEYIRKNLCDKLEITTRQELAVYAAKCGFL